MIRYISVLKSNWPWVAAGAVVACSARPFAALATESTIEWSAPGGETRPSGTHAEFAVSLEPISIQKDGSGREELELASEVDSAQDKATKSMVSVRVADDRGNLVVPRAVSPSIDVDAKSRVSAGHVVIPPLADGWYQVIANAVFADDSSRKEIIGSEMATLYLHVEEGEVEIVDPDDWYTNSNSGEGWNVP